MEFWCEGYEPLFVGQGRPWRCYIDQLDGTSNTCRWIQAGNRKIGSAVATVIAIAPNHPGITFGDVQIGTGLDLRNGQYWIASKGQGAFTGQYHDPAVRRLKFYRQYDRHVPLLACEFYRQINWATRLLVNQPVEWSDCASSFMNMLRVPLGETDCYFNNLFPEISPEGQRGHELGAIMPFVKELGGHAVDIRRRQPLEATPFTFDGMTPVIIGVDEETVNYYLTMVRENLQKKVKIAPGVELTVQELLPLLHQTVGTQPVKLRPIPTD